MTLRVPVNAISARTSFNLPLRFSSLLVPRQRLQRRLSTLEHQTSLHTTIVSRVTMTRQITINLFLKLRHTMNIFSKCNTLPNEHRIVELCSNKVFSAETKSAKNINTVMLRVQKLVSCNNVPHLLFRVD